MHNRFLSLISSIQLLALINVGYISAQSSIPEIKIHYLGHSAFVIQFDNGINIVTDYGKENAWVEWGWDSPINDIGDLIPNVMTFSHKHEDHYDSNRIPIGVNNILTGLDSLIINGINIKPVRTCETNINIESNASYIFTYKGLKICHLGDAQAQIMNINNTEVLDNILEKFPDQFDLLLMTIEGQQQFISEAETFVSLLNPKRIIPMHYWSENYLQDFLNYLELQNTKGKDYQIQQGNDYVYCLYASENIEVLKVISLKRAPFSQQTNVVLPVKSHL